MKFEVTLETIEEIALCIVDNGLNQDDAVEYAKAVIMEVNGVSDVGES